jgi:hypothetical protein
VTAEAKLKFKVSNAKLAMKKRRSYERYKKLTFPNVIANEVKVVTTHVPASSASSQ